MAPSFNCDATVTHEVALDTTDPGFFALGEECEQGRLAEMDFCFNDAVVQEQNGFETCSQHFEPEDPEGGGESEEEV